MKGCHQGGQTRKGGLAKAPPELRGRGFQARLSTGCVAFSSLLLLTERWSSAWLEFSQVIAIQGEMVRYYRA